MSTPTSPDPFGGTNDQPPPTPPIVVLRSDGDPVNASSPEASHEKFSLDQVGYWVYLLPDEFVDFLRKQELLEESAEDAIDSIKDGLGEDQYDPGDIRKSKIHTGLDILGRVDAVVSSGKYTAQENVTIEDALAKIEITPENRLAFNELLLRKYDFETILDIYIWGGLALQEEDLGGNATLHNLFGYVYRELLQDAEELMKGNYNNGSSRISVHHHHHGMKTFQVVVSALVLAALSSRYADINGKQVQSDADRVLGVVAECVEGLRDKVREIFSSNHSTVPPSNPATESDR